MSGTSPRHRHFGVPIRSASHYRPRTFTPLGVCMLVVAVAFFALGGLLAWLT